MSTNHHDEDELNETFTVEDATPDNNNTTNGEEEFTSLDKKNSFTSPSQELFAKYVRLENNLKNMQRKYDQLTNEKGVLDKVLKSKDAALVKTQLDFENSVEQLEKVKDALRIRDTQIKNLKAEKKSLEEMSSINQLSRKRDVERSTTHKSNFVTPEDSLDTIISLENELKLKQNEISSLQNEINTLKKLSDKKDKALESLDDKLKQSDYKHDKAYEMESKNSELNIQLEKANKEIRTLQEISRMKTKTIEKLNEEIEVLKGEEEQFKDHKKKSVQSSKEMERLKTELQVAKRSIEKKDKEMMKILNEKDTIPLKSLEGDKRVLQSEIKKHLEKIATLERTVQFHEKKSATLSNRLSSITQAIKEAKLERVVKVSGGAKTPSDDDLSQQTVDTEESDIVPVALYTVLERTVEELRKVGCERDIGLSDKDTVIESLERKVEIIEKSKQSDLKNHKRQLQSLQNQIDEMNQKIADSEEQHKVQENKLKKEAFSVKKKLHQTIGIRKN
jgi:chromosome segregation ATPase